ncbi:MAG: DUF1294 domain-containing protein [Clostridiales bacterium]|nr:DUF1294 domain-containing protein [Clostridiales bacterium]
MMKFFIAYLVIINVAAFLLFAYDKRQAKSGGWRVPEATLLMSCFLGGSVGGLAAMNFCRHKTKKPLFYIGVPVIIAIHALLLAFCYHKGMI